MAIKDYSEFDDKPINRTIVELKYIAIGGGAAGSGLSIVPSWN